MKSNTYIYLLIVSMTFVGIQKTMNIDSIMDINSIIQKNTIQIISTKSKQINENRDKISLKFYANNVLLAESRYSTKNDSKWADIDYIEVVSKYRSCGLGEHIFYQTMYKIHEAYPKIEHVEWIIHPHDPPKNISLPEAFQLLFKFYGRVGATVDEWMGKGYINLKDAGYFDEN